jgi:hypothetical protein
MAEPSPPYPPSYEPPAGGYSQNPGQPYGLPYPADPLYAAPASVPPVPVTSPYPVTAQAATPYPTTEPVVAQFGEIEVTSTTVRTPAGQFPLRGCRWDVSDQWTAEQKIPTWAIVLAVVGFFCLTLFSLLFLLAKETVYRGVVQVRVSNGPYSYVTRIAVTNQALVQQVYQQVNYVRSLSAM